MYFSENYGWFQASHLKAHNIVGNVEDAIRRGGNEFTVRDADVTGCVLETTYWVSGETLQDDSFGIALAIFMDFQWRWEAHQEQCSSAFSSYSIEDLPSNMLAFIADMQGRPAAELLEQLEAYKANRERVPVVSEESLKQYCAAEGVPLEQTAYLTEELPPDGVGRLVDFLPKRLDVETCQYEVVEWPWELPRPISEVNEIRVWCRVSQLEDDGVAGPAFFEFDDCQQNDG